MKRRVSTAEIKGKVQAVFGRVCQVKPLSGIYKQLSGHGVYVYFPLRTGETVEQCKKRLWERLNQLPACDE